MWQSPISHCIKTKGVAKQGIKGRRLLVETWMTIIDGKEGNRKRLQSRGLLLLPLLLGLL